MLERPDPISVAVKFSVVPGAIHTRRSAVPRVALNEDRTVGSPVSTETIRPALNADHTPQASAARTRQEYVPSATAGNVRLVDAPGTWPLEYATVVNEG